MRTNWSKPALKMSLEMHLDTFLRIWMYLFSVFVFPELAENSFTSSAKFLK